MPSTVIAEIKYDLDKQILQIRFVSGLVYNYLEVPEEIFEGLKYSRSKGIFFNRYIKDQYEFVKVS